jgi:parallel beta-helix repeat protein
MRKIYTLFLFLSLTSGICFSNTFVVTNTNDNGNGSLRTAINNANMNAGADSITFNIQASDVGYNTTTGVWTIAPDSALPYIWSGNTIIDGTTQTAKQGNTNPNGPEICINGNNVLDYCFALASSGNIIKGFIMGQFNNAIELSTANSNTISDNYIGVNYNGSLAYANTIGVVIYTGANNNTIMNNVISGNIMSGITISVGGNNMIKGNKIGTDAGGTIAIANGDGIELSNTTGNIIGGTIVAERNIISGSTNTGIVMNGTGTNNNTIKGNYIGTDYTGLQMLSNYTGIILKSQSNKNTIGGSTATERNIISGNTEIGVYIESSDSNKVSGNYVGPDITGNAAFKVGDSLWQGNGIEVNTTSRYNTIGGTTTGERNVISGNRVYGFIYYGNVSNNPLIGNYIGTNAAGTSPLPNATGICVDGGSNHNNIINNLLSGNISYGIFIVTTGTNYNQLKGNLIGTNAAGTDTIPNDIGLILAGGTRYNIIGGTSASDRNIISGNRFDGIEISDQKTDSNQIIGNYIGTDINGSTKLGNAIGIGIATYPKHNLISGNVISGNKRMGIMLYEHADSNKVVGNKIGTAANGTSNLGNNSAGIAIYNSVKGNIIGEPGNGNIIAYDDSAGIVMVDANSKYNKISANSMWGNIGLGIDLYPPLVNMNDAGDNDTGPNDLMNFPVITSAEFNSASNYTIVKGTLDTHHPELCTVEIFKAYANFFGYGDGQTYLGAIMPDSLGNWCDTINGVVNNDLLTTTATDELQNTSEFSANKTVSLFVSTNDIAETNEIFSIFPNPSNDFSNIVFNVKEQGLAQIEIWNYNGQLIFRSGNIPCTEGTNKFEIGNDISLSAGIYLVKLQLNDRNFIALLIHE